MNLLITGAWQGTEAQITQIVGMGHRVSRLPWEKDPLPCPYEWVEGVICNGLFLSHPIERFRNLRYIQLTSAGFDRVPMEYVKAHGIEIHNAKDVYSIPMAEFAVCGVLDLYKQSRFFQKNQENHRWEKHRGLRELYGRTVCIVGCGSVGTECAKRFRAFGCRVLGVAATGGQRSCFDAVTTPDRLETVLGEADIVVLAVPLTDRTRHLMDAEKFGRMKRGAILVNIARGAVVDSEALRAALEGHLGGAVLDVFEEEPLEETSGFWDLENVRITPHSSFIGEGNGQRMWACIRDNIECWGADK
ncbi:MAG: D-2-hydroxyacid dehydrogenase [Oscillospiraceae bacterium]